MRDSNGMHRDSFTFTRTVLNGIEMVRGLYIREALRKTTMARITPIDVIKGISGKYGNGIIDSSVLTAVGELLMFGVMAQVPHLIEAAKNGKSIRLQKGDFSAEVSFKEE